MAGFVMTTHDIDRLAAEVMDADDLAILATLGAIHRANDPVPDGLADRARLAISIAALEAEVAELVTISRETAGVRGGYELAATMTFSGTHLSAMVSVLPSEDGTRRVHGWVDHSAVRIELRSANGTASTTADGDGRFAFDVVRPGFCHLVFWRTDLPDAPPLMTPAMEI
jgi:hypothetical protein